MPSAVPSHRATSSHSGAAPRLRLLCIGASAGGLNDLFVLLRALPATAPFAVCAVLHLSPNHHSHMAELLAQRSDLEVHEAHDGDRLSAGVVYTAPPDVHLIVKQGRVRLTHAPAVRFSRPAIDVLFESAAAEFGPDAVGLVLSGMGKDGAAGIAAIKRAGGFIIVLDPAGTRFRSMPEAAVATGCADLVLPLEQIAAALMEQSLSRSA